MSKDFLSSVLGQIIVSNLTNATRNKNRMQYYYSSLLVEMQLGNPSSKARIGWDFLTFLRNQQGEVSLLRVGCLKTAMISGFFLFFDAFLNHEPINKPAKNNKRMLIAAVFHFVEPVQKEG